MQNPAWKKHQVKRKWQSIISVFITVTLLFAIVNGLMKGFSLKNQFTISKWDGKSSLAIVISTKNPSLFIYKNDPKRVVVLTTDSDILYQTGKDKEVLKKVSSDILNSHDMLTNIISHTYGARIENYLMVDNKIEMDNEFSKKLFINFASITTPLKLITYGWGDDIKSTNITRLDAIRLWWQLKSLSIENLSLVDLSGYTNEIINYDNQKVLGADTVLLNRVVSKYLENIIIISENKKIRIQNGTADLKVANLAASFIKSVGGNVIEVTKSDIEYQKTQIVTSDKDSYTANYLAKIFSCDINGAQNVDRDDDIIIMIGSDFAQFYFE